MNALRKIFTPQVRTFVYAVSAILHTVALVTFGITEENWVLYSTAGLALFDTLLALVNTPGVTNKVIEPAAQAAPNAL